MNEDPNTTDRADKNASFNKGFYFAICWLILKAELWDAMNNGCSPS